MNENNEVRKDIIQDCLDKGMKMKEIGRFISNKNGEPVSRQRVYQLITRYGLSTPERKKHNYWKNQSREFKWLNRTLLSKRVPYTERIAILNKFKDNLPTHCPILEKELIYGADGIRNDYSASIDRIDTDKGYTVDNVQIISWRANRIKNDSTPDEILKMAEYIWLTNEMKD